MTPHQPPTDVRGWAEAQTLFNNVVTGTPVPDVLLNSAAMLKFDTVAFKNVDNFPKNSLYTAAAGAETLRKSSERRMLSGKDENSMNEPLYHDLPKVENNFGSRAIYKVARSEHTSQTTDDLFKFTKPPVSNTSLNGTTSSRLIAPTLGRRP